MAHNEIPAPLLAAYRQTQYWVHAEPPFLLQIDKGSEALKTLYREYQVESAAFITAYNPWSKSLGEAENLARQSRLEAKMADAGFPTIPGIGQDPTGEWPGEISCLILGIDRETALRLGKEHEQNAIVWCDSDACPKLLLSKT